MTSNNQINMIPDRIKIKIESDTTLNIKTEPGTSQRLATLKLPRDLKLGGTKTKIMKPNLNVVRNKRTEPNSPVLNNRGKNRPRTRGNDKGKGASRGKSNTVQSYGVFSEGIAENLLKKSSQYAERFKEDRDYEACKFMDKPTINKSSEIKIDKEQEDLIMNDLLSNNIEADDPYAKNDLHPIQLPVNRYDEHTPEIKLENFVVKQENSVMENGSKEKKIFETQEKLLLFQFPDTLPGIGPRIEPENNFHSSSQNDKLETDKQIDNKCTLQDVNEGLLGKILIYKSGKTKLVIGKNHFDIDMGPDAGFLQDVMSVPVNATSKTGDMINLGSIEGNVIVSPEWNALLKSD